MNNNELKLQSNEIFEAGAYIQFDSDGMFELIGGINVPMSTIVEKNILDDYSKNGIIGAKVGVFCGGNYINGENTKIIYYNYATDKNLIEIGDIVNVIKTIDEEGTKIPFSKQGNNDILFRVISTTFKYEGQPYQELKLMQIK
ncbi:MAG: hypothetical protein KBS91_03945 [Firmicutes bacterium]|nr:hypothetical protein [Candidatus Caballimonas caccae]